jgi:hypothetical protein
MESISINHNRRPTTMPVWGKPTHALRDCDAAANLSHSNCDERVLIMPQERVMRRPATSSSNAQGGAGVIRALVLVLMAAGIVPASAAPRQLADVLTPGKPSCHARVFDAADLAAHPGRRVTAISFERNARDLAAERKWGALEQFDGTPVVSATLHVRLRGDPISHAAHLECVEGGEGSLVCTSPNCEGGQIQLTGEGRGALAILIGGALKGGRFIGHYIHLDESCEGRAGGPIVLESGDDDRSFSLAPLPKEACQ